MMNERIGKGLFYIAFSLLFFSTNLPYTYAEAGIDPSWWTSLVMAIEQGEVFGRDFIFNYGPLGFLNTGLLPEGLSPLFPFVFQVFILVNFLFIIGVAFAKPEKNWLWVGIFAIFILLPWGFIADATFTLFYLLLFWLLFIFKTRNPVPLLLCVIIAVLIFYIKVNLSLIAYGLFIGSFVFFALAKTLTTRTSAIAIALLLLVTFSFSFLLRVDIPAYLGASLKIIDAYQDAMAVKLVDGWELSVLLGFFFLILGIVLFLVVRNLSFFKSNFYLYFVVALACFLNFRQAFTATGHYNIFGFFLFTPPLVLLVYLFLKHNLKGLPAKVFIAVLVLQLVATQFIRVSYTGYNLKSYVNFAFPDAVVKEYELKGQLYQFLKVVKYKNPVNYIKALYTYDYERNFNNELINSQRKLPSDIIEKIGQNGFDVLPWESSYAFFNKLKYTHRPIIQSYQANSDWLASQNESFYFSSKAPDFVLATIGDFRSQNPYWMDKGAYLALFKNYSLTDTLDDKYDVKYLFQKNSLASNITSKILSESNTELLKKIEIPQNIAEPLYLKAKVNYNWKGKLARLFFQPPYLMATVSYENGKSEDFRLPPPILEGGILVNKKVTTQEEFVAYQLFKGVKTQNIVSLKLWSANGWGFKESFEYTFEQIK
ncbi:hypothetical protein SAMN06298216_2078 [Spirosomataceae bacterium TFI 002]|nr:hypothetical protein SAMN06298216_2078 [Spirosomataceae bacterium TFI 002]